MSKLSKSMLKRMILQEMEKMMDEAELLEPSMLPPEEHGRYLRSKHKKRSMCEQCGSAMYEGQCMECGYAAMEESCSKHGVLLYECGCMAADDDSDYSIDSMGMIGDALGVLTSHGYDVDATKGHHGHNNNYMAKAQLFKIAEYAQKLHDMIPDGHELDDWQRSHLSSIADDISEVYHSLSYKMHKGEI